MTFCATKNGGPGNAIPLNRRGIKIGRIQCESPTKFDARVTPEVMASLRTLAHEQSMLLSENGMEWPRCCVPNDKGF